MIKFEGIDIQGFGSIMDLQFKFRPGLNIIKAENGEGKTTIFNAWYWCLTGDTLKPKCSINTWPHIQPFDYQGTKVEVTFKAHKKSYHIIRCHEYQGKVDGVKGNNRLIVKEDGEPINLKGKVENQEYLTTVLGYSPNLLKNTLIFGQKLKRLIDETGSNKKEILEEAFEIMFINEAQDKAKRERQKKLSEYSPIQIKFHTLKTQLEGKKELMKQALENEQEFETSKQERVNRIKTDISNKQRDLDFQKEANQKTDLQEVKRKVFELNKDLKKLEKDKESYYELMSDIARLDARLPSYQLIEKREKEVVRLENILNKPLKECPTCGQKIKGDHHHKVEEDYKNQIKSLKTNILELNSQYESIKGDLAAKKGQLSSLKPVIDNIQSIQITIKKLEEKEIAINNGLSLVDQYEKRLLELKDNLKNTESEELKKKSTKIKLDIRKLKREIKPIKDLVKAFKKELTILEWLINDPLSNSGLKTFIFRDMIHLLNSRMAEYSKYFGFRVEFDVNMESARKDIDAYIFQGEEIIPYQDLSGGQAQSVAVIMAFALHDIVAQGRKASNILLMDEIFENLSKTNIERVTEIILKKLGNLSINLITHRNEFNPYNSRTIKLKRVDGITLVETV